MNKLMAIVTETYTSQVKTKSFLLMLLMPFLFVLVSAGIGFITGNNAANSSDDQVAIIAPSAIRKAVTKLDSDAVDAKIKTKTQAERKLKAAAITGYVTVTTEHNQLMVHYVGKQSLASDVQTNLMNVVALKQHQLNVQNSHLTPDQQAQLMIQPQFTSKVKHQANNDDQAVKMVSLQAVIFILYFFIIMYASITATVIAKEKGSKVIEIIFSSTTSTNYFIGKVTGMILMLLTQLAVYVLIIGFSYQFLRRAAFLKAFMHGGGDALIGKVFNNLLNLNMGFILVGLILFIVLAALCGALVAKKEDASKAVQPLVLLIFVLFIAAMAMQTNSNSIVARVLSYLPVSSTFFMPMRLINGQVTNWQALLALVILIGFTGLLTFWIAKQYKGLMLQSDDQKWWRNLARGLKKE